MQMFSLIKSNLPTHMLMERLNLLLPKFIQVLSVGSVYAEEVQLCAVLHSFFLCEEGSYSY